MMYRTTDPKRNSRSSGTIQYLMVTYDTPFDERTLRLLRCKMFAPTYCAGMRVTIIAEMRHKIFSTSEGIWNGYARQWMAPKAVATFDHAMPWRPLKIASIRVTTPVTVGSWGCCTSDSTRLGLNRMSALSACRRLCHGAWPTSVQEECADRFLVVCRDNRLFGYPATQLYPLVYSFVRRQDIEVCS